MFSSAVRVGTRLKAWNTKPIRSRRSRVRSLSFSVVRSASPMKTLPRGGRVQAGHAVHEGRLARARRAHDGGEPPHGELHVHGRAARSPASRPRRRPCSGPPRGPPGPGSGSGGSVRKGRRPATSGNLSAASGAPSRTGSPRSRRPAPAGAPARSASVRSRATRAGAGPEPDQRVADDHAAPRARSARRAGRPRPSPRRPRPRARRWRVLEDDRARDVDAQALRGAQVGQRIGLAPRDLVAGDAHGERRHARPGQESQHEVDDRAHRGRDEREREPRSLRPRRAAPPPRAGSRSRSPRAGPASCRRPASPRSRPSAPVRARTGAHVGRGVCHRGAHDRLWSSSDQVPPRMANVSCSTCPQRLGVDQQPVHVEQHR